jgi:protein-S-isoprenylcysteine O-methyltransferase Ste14
MATLALFTVIACWLLFGGILLKNHLRVRKLRGPESPEAQKKSLRAPASMYGLMLEGAAIAVGCGIHRPLVQAPQASLAAAIVIGPASVWFTVLALRHLDLEWRVKAVVTEDHKLVTTGPYSVVRHPIFLSFFGVTLATALVVAPWQAIALSAGLYIVGTEIRIRAEDQLLARRFGADFESYRDRVKPFVR